MHTMFEQAPVSGLAITCMKTVLEHGSFYVIPIALHLLVVLGAIGCIRIVSIQKTVSLYLLQD